ncbi:MAG: proline--tRNA ligase [Candidatus ainarchaeum sp.]|nr:proline--tRNA ligase [Candidatus ainarchaeum sp.]
MDTPKENFSEWYNEIIKEAQLCDLRYNLKGFVVIPPNAAQVMKLMYRIYEESLERKGHRPAYFPALIPERNLKSESEHVAGFVPEVFWVTEAGANKLEEKMAMRPTSETAMYPMYALWINGKSDLPLKIYQSCQVWRHETKATKPFIRTREFYWIEAHDVFATEEEALMQVNEDMETTEEILHQRFGVPFIFFKRPQWDKFAGALDTYAADTLMPDGKTLQLPSTHMLGQNFSKAFGVKYMDEDGAQKFCWQTCYGPAISRIYAAIFSTHGDNRGLVYPFELAPVQVVIIPIVKKDTEAEVRKKVDALKEALSAHFRVEADFSNSTPGFKYNKWELLGVPIRIEIGMRDIQKGACVMARRDTGEKEEVKLEKAEEEVRKAGASLTENLCKRADSWFSKLVHGADSDADLGKAIEKGGFVRVPFCTDQKDGEHCADRLKDKYSVNMRGSRYGDKDKPKGKRCVACGKPASIYLYAARQY